jgi:tetratricopeptide (TPR) repeat protein
MYMYMYVHTHTHTHTHTHIQGFNQVESSATTVGRQLMREALAMLQAETRELEAAETRKQSTCARTHPRTHPIPTSEQRMLARSCFRMAVFLWSDGAVEETQALYRRGLRIDPSKAEAWNNLAVSLQASSQKSAGLVGLFCPYTRPLLRLVLFSQASGKTQDAEAAFEKALLLNPSSPQVAYTSKRGLLKRPTKE